MQVYQHSYVVLTSCRSVYHMLQDVLNDWDSRYASGVPECDHSRCWSGAVLTVKCFLMYCLLYIYIKLLINI